MPVVKYSTTVSVEKTVNEIQKRLAANGARRIAIDYSEQGRPQGVIFTLEHPHLGASLFSLPIDAEAMQRVIRRDLKMPKNSKAIGGSIEQAERVAWRVLQMWIDAQMALIASEMVDLTDVMLPYLVVDTHTGKTLREAPGLLAPRELE